MSVHQVVLGGEEVIEQRPRLAHERPRDREVGRVAAVLLELRIGRKHLLAHWRYRPATEDGRAIATSIVITLRFELNG